MAEAVPSSLRGQTWNAAQRRSGIRLPFRRTVLILARTIAAAPCPMLLSREQMATQEANLSGL